MLFFRDIDIKLGRYPSCEMLNTALRFLLRMPTKEKEVCRAITEIYWAVVKADGYFTADVEKMLDEQGYKNKFDKEIML